MPSQSSKDRVEEIPVAIKESAGELSESRLSKMLRRITVDPQVCHGEPCIRGRRIMVSTIINSLRGGMSYDDLLLRYPDLSRDDIEAAIIYSHRK